MSRSSAAALDVEDDRVAVAHGRDRAAARRLRRDVADHQAVRRAREAAVGDQRDLVAEALADERAGHVQHLAHAGAAGRALVADHDHVAGLDRARLDGGEARPPRSRRRAPGRGGSSRSWPASLTTQPSGASEPRRIARPPVGLDRRRRTRRRRPGPAVSTTAAPTSPIVRPSTPRSSAWMRPAPTSSRATRPTPPASWRSVAT